MWQKKDDSLYRRFQFKSFAESFGFLTEVAGIAETQNHHPKMLCNYDCVELWLTTHEKGRVTTKDEVMAQEIDRLLETKQHMRGNKIERAKLYTDGGSRGNPGPSALGFVILDFEDNVVKKDSRYSGETTNNQAEYNGLIAGLEQCTAYGVKIVEVYMDSLLVVNQMKGIFKIKNAELATFHQKAQALAGRFESINFTHVPRAVNNVADKLVNECLDLNS